MRPITSMESYISGGRKYGQGYNGSLDDENRKAIGAYSDATVQLLRKEAYLSLLAIKKVNIICFMQECHLITMIGRP